MLRFAVTIFLSAFLLFQVQPLIGKCILPWFGGGSAVWTTCLLFFQLALLAGYLYAHVLAGRTPRTRGLVHLALLVGTLLFLPIGPDPEVWRVDTGAGPTWRILALLLVSIGMPYLMLSSTGPMLQDWFAATYPGRSPYRLYALSNVGSLLALLSYPFAMEPMLALGDQMWVWSVTYGVFAGLSGWCALRFAFGARSTATVAPGTSEETPVSAGRILLWLLLAAAGSAMLLATTNQLCLDVASFPFLWVVPLSLYLLTFVIAFDKERWYDRRVFGVLLVVGAVAACYVLGEGASVALWLQVLIYGFVLFACCMTCHGELVRRKPAPRHLTLFYLMVATGGALGGILVAIVAPRVFDGYWEFHIALASCCALGIACWYGQSSRGGRRVDMFWGALAAAQAVLIFVLYRDVTQFYKGVELSSRNFYGVLRVVEDDILHHGRRRILYNGHIDHGGQFLKGEQTRWPVSYYGADTALGLALLNHPARAAGTPLRIGVVGLGVGTIATYGRAGDVIRFYEINPEVERIAREEFTYLTDTAASTEIVLGDARLRIEDEINEGTASPYDVLIVDAFTGDSIPMHLLTLECFRLYFERLGPDGVLLVHISNRFLDLVPVIRGVAAEMRAAVAQVESYASRRWATSDTSWVALTRDGETQRRVLAAVMEADEWDAEGEGVLWTDDFSSLWPLLAARVGEE